MSVESFLQSWFDTVTKLDVGGMRGQKFVCQTIGGEKLFIKARQKEEWGWFNWGLKKEHKVCEDVNTKISYVPNSPVLFETNTHTIVGYEYTEHNSDLDIYDLYTDTTALTNIIEDLNELLVWLYENSHSVGMNITNMRNREHVSGNGFESMKSYIFNDRLQDGVYFNDDFYDEYIDNLEKTCDLLQDRYNMNRERFVHGDLSNSHNVLYDENGVNSVVDWELSGWFDYLYDVAFVEATFIDLPCAFNDNITASELRKILYENLNITVNKKQSLDLYKVWPHYMGLESVSMCDEIPHSNVNIENEFRRRKTVLDLILGKYM